MVWIDRIKFNSRANLTLIGKSRLILNGCQDEGRGQWLENEVCDCRR